AALEHLGPAARAATADLCRSIGSTDAELRLAALRALGAIGAPDASVAVPEIAAALRDSDPRIGLVAAQVLAKFGPAAREAVPALCQAVQESSSDVHREAGDALLNVLPPGTR